MKRFAYLLSNTNGLPGISKDVEDFRNYLISNAGGAWNPKEIFSQQNPSLSLLRSHIASLREQKFDYVVFYYTGHGSYERGTCLYINENDEYIKESEVLNLAPKQLSLFDCCRVIQESSTEGLVTTFDEAVKNASYDHQRFRDRFDSLVKAALPQQVKLYACRIGEKATATRDGSLYTQGLLETARNIDASQDANIITVHNKCISDSTIRELLNKRNQHPDIDIDIYGKQGAILPFVLSTKQRIFW